jgi:hypothetical protein
MKKVSLPSGLRYLTSGYTFNQHIGNVASQPSLHILTFGYSFNQHIEQVAFPS